MRQRQAEGPAESPAFTAPPLVDGCQITARKAPAAATERLGGQTGLLFLPVLARRLVRWRLDELDQRLHSRRIGFSIEARSCRPNTTVHCVASVLSFPPSLVGTEETERLTVSACLMVCETRSPAA